MLRLARKWNETEPAAALLNVAEARPVEVVKQRQGSGVCEKVEYPSAGCCGQVTVEIELCSDFWRLDLADMMRQISGHEELVSAARD